MDPAEHPTPAVLRIGIINLMPRAELYERSLVAALRTSGVAFRPRFVRLVTHAYLSSDRAHIAGAYQRFDELVAEAALDGLIITGAPVEELDWHDVMYWAELCEIMQYARAHVPSTLGLCWGGLALARQLGVEKVGYAHKLFGVLPLSNLAPRHPLLAGSGDPIPCPQSRHSGIADADFERAAADGLLHGLAYAPAAGYSIFESEPARFIAHLGHPEYEPERLLFEYERDLASGRPDVRAPENVDLARPACSWERHRRDFFGGWLAGLRHGAR